MPIHFHDHVRHSSQYGFPAKGKGQQFLLQLLVFGTLILISRVKYPL